MFKNATSVLAAGRGSALLTKFIFAPLQSAGGISDGGLNPATNTNKLLTAYRGGSHPSSDIKVKITDDGVNRTYSFAKYLHDSLPNATYIGFTDTPIDATVEMFGDIVGHPYTMTEAIKDEKVKVHVFCQNH